jgi:hypothetical protein
MLAISSDLLEQRGGATRIMNNDVLTAQLVYALREANHAAVGIRSMGASLAKSIDARGDDRAEIHFDLTFIVDQLHTRGRLLGGSVLPSK